MPFTYNAVTANCGNDSIGEKAIKKINAQLVAGNKLDFTVINCQEVNYEKTLSDIKKTLPTGYEVKLISSMVTKTKADTLLGGTGLGTFIIYNTSTVSVEEKTPPQEARRSFKNIYGIGGTAYNKGGVVSGVTIKKGGEEITLQSVSGHLDSKKIKERTQDWGVIQSEIAKSRTDVKTFDQLKEAIPDLRISGYDANTRSRLTQDQGHVNLWQTNDYEVGGMLQAPLGGGRYSSESTYKTHKVGIDTEPDTKKRIGYTKGGMLDFVDIADGSPASEINTAETIIVDSDDKTTERDHAVVITPPREYNPQTPFDKVKNQMAGMLEKAAPTLAEDIRNLSESPENEAKLVDVYQTFLSKDGLLIKELNLHAQKLGIVQKSAPEDKEAMKNKLFPDNEPWFKSVNLNNYLYQERDIAARQNAEFGDVAGMSLKLQKDSKVTMQQQFSDFVGKMTGSRPPSLDMRGHSVSNASERSRSDSMESTKSEESAQKHKSTGASITSAFKSALKAFGIQHTKEKTEEATPESPKFGPK